MSLIYNAGCKYYLNRGPQDATTETLYRDCLVLTRISSYFGLLTPFLVIVCTMLHRYVLTKAFLTKCYGKSFASLDTRQQSAFRFHHIDLVVKTSSLMFTSRPTFKVFVRGQNWYDPFYNDSSFALGDSVSIGASIVAALFIFHICSAQRLKLLDFAHHAGAIFAIQAYPAWSTSQAIDEVLRLKEAKKMANTCLLWILFAGAYSSIKAGGHIIRRCFFSRPVAFNRLCTSVYYVGLIVTVLEALSVLCIALAGWNELPTFGMIALIFLQVVFTFTKWKHIRLFCDMRKRANSIFGIYGHTH